MTLRINVLGGLNVEREGMPVAGAAAQPRRVAILALLARADNRGVTRARLMSLLWPDVDEDRARRSLTQAIYALRHDLGDEEAILGIQDLRLDFDRVSTDVRDLTLARSRDALEEAAAAYRGPFLDGFHVQGAEEFDRWADTERRVLEAEYMGVLEQLALRAESRGDTAAAVRWWRQLSARDPLNARTTVALMRALAATGDVRGAIQQARIHELLVEEQLSLPPDREVIALAARLRREARRDSTDAQPSVAGTTVAPELGRPDPPLAPPSEAPPSSPSQPTPNEPATAPVIETDAPARVGEAVVEEPLPSGGSPPVRIVRRWWPVAALAVAGAVVLGVAMQRRDLQPAQPGPAGQPVLVVGRIADFAGPAAGNVGMPLAQMLATNLARAPGLRVIHTARVEEILARLTSNGRDTALGVMIRAAREAGATDLIEGAVYQAVDGSLRLDLRRVDVATGSVLRAHRVVGADLFALADSGALGIVRTLGATLPPGSLADVSTHSAVAYRYYVEGLRAFSRRDLTRADSLFLAALREDSTFAMAWFYHAHSTNESPMRAFTRAVALSDRVSERERLVIRTAWSLANSSPATPAYAESLRTRFPGEVEGSLYLGSALVHGGRFLEGIPLLAQVLDMDSTGLRGSTVLCATCTALGTMVSAYLHADSVDAAERVARRWVALQRDSPAAWIQLGGVLEVRGALTEASQAYSTGARLAPASMEMWQAEVPLLLRRGDFAGALRAASEHKSDSPGASGWLTVLSLRSAGRLREAIAAADRQRVIEAATASTSPGITIQLAQALLEAGRYDSAAHTFDAHYRTPSPGYDEPSFFGRNRAFTLTHVADALAGKGAADTARIAALVDTVRMLGARSGYGRDPVLYHHVRGLLLRARGDLRGAADEFRQAIWSPTFGYTRSNLELARCLISLGRGPEAVAAIQPAFRGSVESSNLYVTVTELHETLARAWDAAGRPDSAVAHYEFVARGWERADPPLARRAAEARARVSALRPAR